VKQVQIVHACSKDVSSPSYYVNKHWSVCVFCSIDLQQNRIFQSITYLFS